MELQRVGALKGVERGPTGSSSLESYTWLAVDGIWNDRIASSSAEALEQEAKDAKASTSQRNHRFRWLPAIANGSHMRQAQFDKALREQAFNCKARLNKDRVLAQLCELLRLKCCTEELREQAKAEGQAERIRMQGLKIQEPALETSSLTFIGRGS